MMTVERIQIVIDNTWKIREIIQIGPTLKPIGWGNKGVENILQVYYVSPQVEKAEAPGGANFRKTWSTPEKSPDHRPMKGADDA